MKMCRHHVSLAFLLCASILTIEQAYAASLSTAVTVTVLPNAPTNLTALATSPTQVQLTWTDNSNNEDGFSIERKTDSGGTYSEIATTGANVATYVDNGVSAGTTYFYQVRAFVGTLDSLYSNEASTTTESSGSGGGGSGGSGGSSGGGGGGGGGYIPAPAPSSTTNVVLNGSAYPLSKVVVLKDGQVAVQTVAGPDAAFSATIGNLTGGSYSFSVYGEDNKGYRSIMFTFPVTITPGVTTVISGIFLSPTIDVDKDVVKKGETLTIFGSSIPNAPISIQIHSDAALFVTVTSTASGAYLFKLDTSKLSMGSHLTKSKTSSNGSISNESTARTFTVGTQTIYASQKPSVNVAAGKADLNGDGRVNLIDFSILAYWYKRPNAPAKYDLNGDGKIDLIDFSILAFYWTG